MIQTRRGRAAILGMATAVFAIWLRFAAKDLAWPHTYSYSGPRAETVWAIRETAYVDLSYAFLIFGLAVILLVLVNWLWAPALPPSQD